MWRNLTKGAVVVALLAAALLPALANAQGVSKDGHYAAAKDEWLYGPRPGGTQFAAPEVMASPSGLEQNFNQIGTLWDGGPTNGVNGLASERSTFTSGSGGPEGDHIATIANDFEVPGLAAGSGSFLLEEFRICFYAGTPTFEAYLYQDGGGQPAPPVTNVIWGRSSTNGLPDAVSTTFADNGSRCQGAFGYPGRQVAFNTDTTGITMPVVGTGIYWVAAVGQGPGAPNRAFWADSNGSGSGLPNLATGRWGSSVFGFPYWSDTGGQGQPHFAFDIDGRVAGAPFDGVDPNSQLGKQVHLPILNFQGQDDVCRTWIEVQVVGPEYSKAVLVTWGEPGFCPPQCAGPLKVECTGLLKPGSTWNFLGAQVPTGSKGGMLFKFSAKQISEIDPTFGGEDDIVADYMCETLFFGVVGDCDDWRRFKKAYNENLEFAGLNMGTASGKGYLAVDVLRHCPGDVTPGVEVSSKYNGIAGDHLGSFDPIYGGYGFYVPLLYADKAGFNSVMYIQNGGLECSSIEIWFKAQDDCLRARICEIFTLAPGETYQFDSSDCVGPDWQGSAWLRSTQPLGIAVDIIGRDVLMTYIGEPSEYAYDPDATGLKPKDAAFTQGNLVAFGPLMYSEYQGWDTGVQVQNLSAVVNAKVKVYFLDRSGDVITTLVDWICPRGSQTFFLPVIADLPGNWVGSIRVESQEWWTPGSPAVSPPNIVGVATLIKYNDAARSQTTEAIAYNLLPEHKIYIWQIGGGPGGVAAGVGLIAIPSLIKDLEATGVTSEVAIANIVPKPGFTDFAIFIYDQNGLLDYICQKLNEKQVEYINLQTWGYVNPGFKGSAIISAIFWEHDVFSPTGLFLRNLVGLGAVSVERTGTRLGEDVPGDEAAGSRGIPFAAPGGRKDFRWQGPGNPNCPGIGRISP